MMNIAVFADLHGRILLAFKLCARWEQETGEKLDLILQAGDMGIFPRREQLDKATMRYAEQDPTELGFMDHFVAYEGETSAVLEKTTCDLIFVRGNHEDHAWLDIREQKSAGPLFFVDVYQRLYCLKTGLPYTYTAGEEQLTILGIGRKGNQSSQVKSVHIQPYEQARLKKLDDGVVDILLTHDMPMGRTHQSAGMAEITTALQHHQPLYHFYGHIGGDCRQGTWENGTTQFCKLADLEWHGAGRVVRAGSMAILRWTDRTTHALSVVSDAWYKEYTATTWQYL